MLSVNRMYRLLNSIAHDLNITTGHLADDLHSKPVSSHQGDCYHELFSLYNAYHAHLAEENLCTIQRRLPDESEWKCNCNTYYNWSISGREYCFFIEDRHIFIKIGDVSVPAFSITCLNNNRSMLIAPRIFPYVFVIAERYERSMDAHDVIMQLCIENVTYSSRVLQVSPNHTIYFEHCFGLNYEMFTRCLAESLYRVQQMRTLKPHNRVYELTPHSSTHSCISPILGMDILGHINLANRYLYIQLLYFHIIA